MKRGYIARIPLHPFNGILLLYTDKESLKLDTGDSEERASNSGITHYTDDCGVFWVGIWDQSPEVIAHEAVHVAIQLLACRGIPISAQNDESIAYLVSFIVQSIHKAIEKQERKVNKEVAPKGINRASGANGDGAKPQGSEP